jgi:hypothetical protein
MLNRIRDYVKRSYLPAEHLLFIALATLAFVLLVHLLIIVERLLTC